MSDYKQTTLAGTAYTRACAISIANPLTGVKAINFSEEQIVNLGDETIIRPQGGFQEPFTAENAGTEFALINPVDGTPLGATATYQQIYVMMHSLYFHLATLRDVAVAEAAAMAAQPPAPEPTPAE
jgi:hypothetical protein